MKLRLSRYIKQLRHITARDCVMLAAGAGAVIAGTIAGDIVRARQSAIPPETGRLTIRWLPATVTRWRSDIEAMGKKYRLDPNFIAIIMTMESGGYSKAESPAGAEGLMQVTPPTAGDIAKKFLKEPRDSYDLLNPRTSIEFGTAYLAYLRDEFGAARQGPSWNETVELVAAGYNGGPGAANALEQGKGLRDTETVIYSRDAFNMWRERHAAKSPTYERWVERGGSTLLETAKHEQR